jgi:hypothetical protein
MFGNIPHPAPGEHEQLVQTFVKNASLAQELMAQHIVSAASRFGYDISIF